MKQIIFVIVLALLLTNCKKDDDNPKFIEVDSGQIIKYKINLSDNKITSYEKYINDTLNKTVEFIEKGNYIEERTKNSLGEITYKRFYLMGENGYATSCIDSIYGDSTYYHSTYTYEYDNNGYLTRKIIDYYFYLERGPLQYNYEIENGNVGSFEIYNYACTFYYEYYNIINKLDILHLSNGITGKKNKQLVKRIKENVGCPEGPSMTIAYTDYKYELNNEGYVTRMIEKSTPSYHTNADQVNRTLQTTFFEYSIN